MNWITDEECSAWYINSGPVLISQRALRFPWKQEKIMLSYNQLRNQAQWERWSTAAVSPALVAWCPGTVRRGIPGLAPACPLPPCPSCRAMVVWGSDYQTYSQGMIGWNLASVFLNFLEGYSMTTSNGFIRGPSNHLPGFPAQNRHTQPFVMRPNGWAWTTPHGKRNTEAVSRNSHETASSTPWGHPWG